MSRLTTKNWRHTGTASVLQHLLYDVYLHLFQTTIRCRSWVDFRTTGDGYSQAEIDANSKTAAAEAAAAEEVELENLLSCESDGS